LLKIPLFRYTGTAVKPLFYLQLAGNNPHRHFSDQARIGADDSVSTKRPHYHRGGLHTEKLKYFALVILIVFLLLFNIKNPKYRYPDLGLFFFIKTPYFSLLKYISG
jgi:hypothetical protein